MEKLGFAKIYKMVGLQNGIIERKRHECLTEIETILQENSFRWGFRIKREDVEKFINQLISSDKDIISNYKIWYELTETDAEIAEAEIPTNIYELYQNEVEKINKAEIKINKQIKKILEKYNFDGLIIFRQSGKAKLIMEILSFFNTFQDKNTIQFATELIPKTIAKTEKN